MKSGVIIVSNRLPVTVKKVDGKLDFSPSVGGLATGLASYADDSKNKWIGWPGIASDDLSVAEKTAITQELRERNCYPVFLSQKQIDAFYNGYSNSVLWPLFHNLPLIAKPEEQHRLWRAYKNVNRAFADIVLALSTDNDAIWVHDYQLLLLPKLLREQRSGGKIGFFLHIPFPPANIFTKLPEAKSLLEGVLGTDLIGLHTIAYVDDFLDCCKQLNVGDVTYESVGLTNRTVRVTDFPMGIDYAKFTRAAKGRAVKLELAKLKLAYHGQKVILTVDRLDPSKGLVERLEAYEEFLLQNPEFHRKVTMVMVVVPSRTDIAAYQKLKEKIDSLVKHINETFGNTRWKPVKYLYQALPFATLAAFYQLADVALIVPLRDGMNLVAKEYIASQPSQNGVLILSETAGAAQELKDAIQVEPRRRKAVAQALQQAITMPRRELKARTKRMQQQLEDSPVQKWAHGFMRTLQQAEKGRIKRTFSLQKTRRQKLIADYSAAKKRLLLLDYDGVLRAFVNDPALAIPSKATKKLLTQLAEIPGNEIVIISGRSRSSLEEWFNDLPVGLAAEHGAMLRKPGQKNWQTHHSTGRTWQSEALPILQKFADKVAGASVEAKQWSLVWHYRQASPYLVQKHLVALRRQLGPITKNHDLVLESGNKILELRPKAIDKGAAAQWFLRAQDFVLAIGDDTTDEAMFRALPDSAHTIKVGRGRTAAAYRLANVQDVHAFLKQLTKTN